MDDITWSKSRLKAYQKRIDSALDTFLQKKRTNIEQEAPETLPMYDALARYILRGGKRLRPALVYYTYKLCGGTGLDQAVTKVAMSTDLNHSYFLIHDDIMDRGETRRGGPTLHKELETLYKRRRSPDAEHLGLSQAILMGDFAAAFAIEAITEAPLSHELIHALLRAHTSMLCDTELGQGLDIHLSEQQHATEEDVRTIMKYKTAKYTVLSPIRLGVILAGATRQQERALQQFGERVGTVFQIADDLLGIFGTQKQIGKSNLSDMQEGKHTLLTVRAYAAASKADRAFLEATLGNPNANRTDLKRIQSILKETGAYEQTLQEARTMTEEALRFLEKAEFPGKEALRFFRGMGQYVLQRSS